jgi:hypothetical protein
LGHRPAACEIALVSPLLWTRAEGAKRAKDMMMALTGTGLRQIKGKAGGPIACMDTEHH